MTQVFEEYPSSESLKGLLIASDPLLVDQQSDVIPYIVWKLLLSHSDTVADVGEALGFVLTGYYHGFLVYLQRCNIEDLQDSEAFMDMLKCYWHLSGQAGLLPGSRKPSITLLQALGKVGWGTSPCYCPGGVCPG